MITTWRSTEWSFLSSKKYKDHLFDVELDALFVSPKGERYIVPAFWDGGDCFKLRFAPPCVGKWEMYTFCSDIKNVGLHNKHICFNVEKYDGEHKLYRKGFVGIRAGERWFSYADGTPFFYIGDTHWTMLQESFESSDNSEITSHFCYLVDQRAKQGFTVYQSQTVDAPYKLNYGILEEDLPIFRDLDCKFSYIADKGLVHANAQFMWTPHINNAVYTVKLLDKLSRYWVARYSSYPVMWTLAQEVDNDYYYERGFQKCFTEVNNPWKHIAESLYKYDPYKHPLTAHQEYANLPTYPVGVCASTSGFRNVKGHNWYAAQWKPRKRDVQEEGLVKDFYFNSQSKPVVNYESHYDHLETDTYGARMQGWVSFLNGMFGYGYGAVDIWYYNSDYKKDAVMNETLTKKEWEKKWFNAVNLPAALQVADYMRNFFEAFQWWRLKPDFYNEIFCEMESGVLYSAATVENEIYVVYFYNSDTNTGILKRLDPEKLYSASWFDPRTNRYISIGEIKVADDRTWKIPPKPDAEDWVLLCCVK